MMAGPGDEMGAADGRGRGDFRASHFDRERVVDLLKDAFAQGRLDNDELDSRVGQAFAARTYAELAALTADLPAGSAAPTAGSAATLPLPRQPARVPVRAPGSHTARDVAFGMFTLPLLVLAPFIVIAARTSSQQRRSHGELPPPAGAGRPGPEVQPGQAPGVQPPGQGGSSSAPPPDRPGQTRADVRARRSRAERPSSSGRDAGIPRGVRPLPGAV
jgi:hypothetical protein